MKNPPACTLGLRPKGLPRRSKGDLLIAIETFAGNLGTNARIPFSLQSSFTTASRMMSPLSLDPKVDDDFDLHSRRARASFHERSSMHIAQTFYADIQNIFGPQDRLGVGME